MSQPAPPSLQFDRADFGGAPAQATCSRCKQPIEKAYWLVNGAVTCDACREQIEKAPVEGTRLGRFARAIFFGAIGGAIGAGVWYAVRALTDYEIGFISILVGLLVGNGVRKGSGGRGGRKYQVLAVAITYLSIVSTYVPMIVKEVFKGAEKASAESSAPAATGGTAPATVPPAAPPAPAAPSTPAAAEEKPTLGKAFLALGLFSLLVLAIAMAAPFLGGFENILGILIIAFGLWEAWKINRVTPLEVTGPHELATPAVA